MTPMMAVGRVKAMVVRNRVRWKSAFSQLVMV